MKRTLIIFAKEPQRGKVKTRMLSYLSHNKCLGLYKALLRDSIDIAKKVKVGKKVLAYHAGKGDPSYLSRIRRDFILYRQKGRNLGEKMHNAFLYEESKAGAKTIIIGSDSPTLPPSYIELAFRMLDKKDVVLGPSSDGGYYLVGLKRPCSALFKGIKWSTDTVFSETAKRARRLHRSIGMLKIVYDIDSPGDLALLRSELRQQKHKRNAKWTRKFLKV